MRTKNNSSLAGVRGVDIIRTSLPSQQERQEKERQRKITYHGTPIITNRDMVSVQRNDTIARLDKLEDEIDSNTALFSERVLLKLLTQMMRIRKLMRHQPCLTDERCFSMDNPYELHIDKLYFIV